MEKAIIIYGTAWCGDCYRTRKFFDKNKIAYKWVDVDHDKCGEDFVLLTNRGMRSVPTIIFEDGSILVEPSEAVLTQKLKSVIQDT